MIKIFGIRFEMVWFPKHIAKAVSAMLDGDRLIVFGSASLLASFPELGEQEGSPLMQTYDADFIPYPFEEAVGLMLDEAFGEDRGFHQRFGYHADIVRPRITETFPKKRQLALFKSSPDTNRAPSQVPQFCDLRWSVSASRNRSQGG